MILYRNWIECLEHWLVVRVRYLRSSIRPLIGSLNKCLHWRHTNTKWLWVFFALPSILVIRILFMKLNVQMVASFTWEENKEKNIDEKSLALSRKAVYLLTICWRDSNSMRVWYWTWGYRESPIGWICCKLYLIKERVSVFARGFINVSYNVLIFKTLLNT